jgi:hypothetical protein
VAFAGLASHCGEPFFEKEFTDDGSDPAYGAGPEKILDADSAMEVNATRRSPRP